MRQNDFALRQLATLMLAGGLVAGCSGATKVRDALYSSGAGIGNRYCETRDQALRDSAVTRINEGLREEGAQFTFKGIDCDIGPKVAPSPESEG